MHHIVIGDPHTLCREALCGFIRQSEEDINIDGFGDFAQLKAHVHRNKPDLVLLARDFPGFESSGILQCKIALMVPLTDMVPEDSSDYAGIFPKTLSCKDFIGGIREILAGKKYVPSAMPRRYTAPDAPAQDFGLSPREKDVLGHLVKGESNKDIARALDLQVVTIKLHVRGICRKLKVANRTQAALLAKECGWG